jgi:hypothetical protein
MVRHGPSYTVTHTIVQGSVGCLGVHPYSEEAGRQRDDVDPQPLRILEVCPLVSIRHWLLPKCLFRWWPMELQDYNQRTLDTLNGKRG